MNLLIFILINYVVASNILYISPIASRSHHIWNTALAFGLNRKGHNITMLTHDDEKSVPKNFHLIIMEGIYDNHEQDELNYGIEEFIQYNPISVIKGLYDLSVSTCSHDFATNGLATLMNYPKDFKFDLIVFDITLVQCLYPLIDRFNKPPVVGVTPFLLPHTLSYAFGHPLQPSYTPFYSTDYTDKMTFKERLINYFLVYADILYRTFIALPMEFKMAKKYFGEDTRPLEEIERNISILLSNTDPNLENPLDLPPNIIPVGGLQTQTTKPLPEDLQRIVNNSKNGIIVFSMGTVVRSETMSEDKKLAILNAFARLPQTVFWKIDGNLVHDLPKNVIVRKWLPQNDILAQPNTKLLINHGGGLSSHEAMYHGVPVVSIPVFADQISNAGRLQHKKMAKIINYHSITEKSFYETVKEVLDNPMYRNNIQTLSKRYRDRLNSPLETAIFWTEYVLRHGGAEHLNLASRDMSFFQTQHLDIYVIVLLGCYLIYSVVCLLFTCLKAASGLASKTSEK